MGKRYETGHSHRGELRARAALATVLFIALGSRLGHVWHFRRSTIRTRRRLDDLPAARGVLGDVWSLLRKFRNPSGPAVAPHFGCAVEGDFATPVHIRIARGDRAGARRVLPLYGIHRELAAGTVRLQRGRAVVRNAGAVDRVSAHRVVDADVIDVYAAA